MPSAVLFALFTVVVVRAARRKRALAPNSAWSRGLTVLACLCVAGLVLGLIGIIVGVQPSRRSAGKQGDSSTRHSDGIHPAAIAIFVVGAVIVIALAVLIVRFIIRKSKEP